MGILNERAAEEFIAAGAFTPGVPGFVGIAVDLLVDPACAPAGRRPLRHGFLDTRSPRILVVSGPPSPGLEVALRRMGDDLAASGRIVEQHRLTVVPQATGTVHPQAPVSAIGTATAGIRVGLEAGLDDDGPLGLPRRWWLAHMLTPVLAAAFANSPLRHGRPTGWRSVRQALRRDLATAHAVEDPRAAWTAYVMDTPGSTGASPRQRIRTAGQITRAELERHLAGLRPPVAARGHLELDVADRQPGNDWRIPATVAAVLLDDPRAAEEAEAATDRLTGEPALWERAARDALTDPVLAAAARDCFLAAYGALARQGVSRELRDAVADFTERYVYRGRCPADDILDRATAHQ
ncbi:glutamate-cysteine ligase family protein [Actinoplanes utahensis]|uniref:glutamate-cysteine ligase family protein n=1 Tax=Actinoplanes utahensis TaxID=1869 RepID=UPI00068E15E0|nr:glutamate-cysteine ligase family protein [Actinoplanes utahensis]GIF30008.1 glutamate--cysteine ligase EgtA [Actinoplanes utahensis]